MCRTTPSLRALKPGIRMIDLTPAAIGPYCVPVVNGEQHLDALERQHGHLRRPGHHPDGRGGVARGQGALRRDRRLDRQQESAGPGTRANIDEFTETTSKAHRAVGGAAKGKAIIVLNPAEPPLIMRDTVYTLSDVADEDAVAASVERDGRGVQAYVPGYRLKQTVQFDRIERPAHPGPGQRLTA